MAEYKIDVRASGSSCYYHVRKALGPWPLKNWSWSPVFSTTSRLAAEDWIRETQYTESEEGQKLLREKELKEREEQAKRNRAFEEKRKELEAQGYVWSPQHCWFVNSNGGVRFADDH